MKKTTLFKNALATLLLLCATGPIQAQELILEVQNNKDRYSIVREIKDGEWMVSNFRDGEAVFSWITESSPYANQLSLLNYVGWDSSRVNDFVIFRDTVYFCGTIWRENSDQVAIWGFFPLAGFPYVTVRYSGSPFNTLNRIQVFSVDSLFDLHVVMVGERWWDNDIIGVVDEEIRANSNMFDEHYSYVYKDTNHFDDIILTDNFVVISSQKMHTQIFTPTEGRILSIHKPTIPYTSIFANGGLYWNTSLSASWIDLAKCEDDAFAAAFRYGASSISYLISGYTNGFQHYATVSVLSDFLEKVWDMSYSKDRKVLDVLFRHDLNNISDIFHFDPAILIKPETVKGHRYRDELINSLTSLSYLQSGFIASGYNKNFGNLRLYRYIEYLIKECPEPITKEVGHFEYKQEIKEIELEDKILQTYMFDWENYDGKKTVKKICGE